MSSADDILFAPIEPWREECDKIVRYIQGHRHAPNGFPSTHCRTQRPPNALYLADLCRLHHRDGQKQFFVVVYRSYTRTPPFVETFKFDGRLVFDRYEDGGAPYLKNYPSRSIRDLNLVPNEYNDNYVFATQPEAKAHLQEIMRDDDGC